MYGDACAALRSGRGSGLLEKGWILPFRLPLCPCVCIAYTPAGERCFQRPGEEVLVKQPGGDKNRCCQDQPVAGAPCGSEVSTASGQPATSPCGHRGRGGLDCESRPARNRSAGPGSCWGSSRSGASKARGHFRLSHVSCPCWFVSWRWRPSSAPTSGGEAVELYDPT